MTLNRRDFLKATAAGSVSFFAFGKSSYLNFSSFIDKPNLLFIITDEQRPDTMKAYGNNLIQVPNLNKLASESLVFKNNYVTQPVCTPSRSTIMTGLYPHQTGCTNNNLPLNEDIHTLPELLDDPEYNTAFFGKWHLGDEIFPQHGFKEWAATEDMYRKYYRKNRDKSARSAYYNWLISKGVKLPDNASVFSRNFTSHLPLELSKPRFLQEKAVDFLEKNKKNPFVLYVSFLQPHPPFYGPLNNYYDPEKIKLTPDVGIRVGEDEPLWYRERSASEKMTPEEWKKLTAIYYGLITEVDMSIGVILKKLEMLGLKDNTIVVFTSDHGEMMGAHNILHKEVMYQESAQVPLLIRYPKSGFKQRLIDQPVSSIDIVPTLLKAMGKSGFDYEKFPGSSLLDFAEGKKLRQDHSYIEWTPNYLNKPKKRVPDAIPGIPESELIKIANQNVRTVVSPEGWKLCLSDKDKSQLFNIKKDPYEMSNLFYSKDHDKIKTVLVEKIFNWQKSTNDKIKLNF